VTRGRLANTADAAAIAAALAVYNAEPDQQASAALTAAQTVAAANFPTAIVTLGAAYPPATYIDPNVTVTQADGSLVNFSGTAVQVVVRTTATPLLSSLFVAFANNTVNLGAAATAMVEPARPEKNQNYACVVSGVPGVQPPSPGGDLTISAGPQSLNVPVPDCSFASNTTDNTAVRITASDNTVHGISVVTSGDCTGCDSQTGSLTRPNASFQLPVTNPYAALDNDSLLPLSSLAGCGALIAATQGGTATIDSCPSQLPYPPQSVDVNTTSILINSNGDYFGQNQLQHLQGLANPPPHPVVYYNTSVTLNSNTEILPGTYIFVDSSLTISGGTIACDGSAAVSPVSSGPATCVVSAGLGTGTGVTMIFIRDANAPSTLAAPLTITPDAKVTLIAPKGTTAVPGDATNIKGTLFYGRGLVGSAAAPAVQIAPSSDSSLNGVMYFPGAYVAYGANAQAQPGCGVLVGGTIALNNPGGFDYKDCTQSYGALVPQVLAPKLVVQ
jgi:hypothetical protein